MDGAIAVYKLCPARVLRLEAHVASPSPIWWKAIETGLVGTVPIVDGAGGGKPQAVHVHPAVLGVPGALGTNFSQGYGVAGTVTDLSDPGGPRKMTEHAGDLGSGCIVPVVGWTGAKSVALKAAAEGLAPHAGGVIAGGKIKAGGAGVEGVAVGPVFAALVGRAKQRADPDFMYLLAGGFDSAVEHGIGREIAGVVNGLLFNVRQERDEKTAVVVFFGLAKAPGEIMHRPQRKLLVGDMVVVQRQPQLFEIVATLSPPSRLASRLHRRKQQRYQDGDNGNDDQEFDQCKSSGPSMGSKLVFWLHLSTLIGMGPTGF